jgi:aconitase A
VGDATYQMLALSVLDEFGDPGRLPYSIKVVLENVVPQAAGSRGER